MEELELIWVQPGMSQGTQLKGSQVGQLGPKQVCDGISKDALHWTSPGKSSAVEVVWAWTVPGCFAPVSSW